MKKWVALVLMVGLVVIGVITTLQSFDVKPNKEKIEYAVTDRDTGDLYIARNQTGAGAYVYQMSSDGNTKKFYSSKGELNPVEDILAICYDKGIYYVGTYEEDGEYAVVKLNENLETETIVSCKIPDASLILSSISTSDEVAYLTFLSSDSKKAYVYEMNFTSGEKILALISIQEFLEEEGAFQQATYRNGRLIYYSTNGAFAAISDNISKPYNGEDPFETPAQQLQGITKIHTDFKMTLRLAENLIIGNLVRYLILCVIIFLFLFGIDKKRVLGVRIFTYLEVAVLAGSYFSAACGMGISADLLWEALPILWVTYIPMIVLTVMNLFFAWFVSRPIARYSKEIEMVAKGQKNLGERNTNSKETVLMWNALNEIVKNEKKTLDSKYRMFQAYYRFAPRKIETLLHKDSIQEVHVGDSVMLSGVLGTVSLSGRELSDKFNDLGQINRDFEIISRNQSQQEGILLSNGCNLKMVQLMFMESVDKAVTFGIETALDMEQEGIFREQDATVLLHKTSFIYGVSGSDEQTFPFVSSAEMEAINVYLENLRKMKLRVVITESVLSEISAKTATRYIGYVELKDLNQNMKLYEVLDSYRESERRRMIANADLFQKAMQLYYHNDFYLARNAFNDVLKECPKDSISKWYLFNCERMLNEENMDDFHYGLFAQMKD